ncbi:Drug resistance transporter, EmrB/QacA subfamily [gamma proteobacterium HdN1]|nr:Drug resistance transporter, EmrB/QacA subfamily [gamma proteobacterium HdN1]
MEDLKPMPPASQRWGFVMALLGMFMAILDTQIVASSLTEIQAGVSATLEEVSWIQTSYLIAEIIVIPLAGMLVRWLSTRLAFVLSCAAFTAASAACVLAQTIEQLILLRAIQGFVGGAMIPIVYSVSFSIFPNRAMGAVQATIGLVATLAPSIGPTLGGYITQHAGWHWLFLMNIIPGIIASIGVWMLLDIDKPQFHLLRKIDFLGLLYLALFLGPLEYVLEEGPKHDWFDDTHICLISLLSVTSALLFFRRAFASSFPIVDLRVFRHRNFAVGCAMGFVVGIALYGVVYMMPMFLGGVRHLNSLQIGAIMFVTGAVMFLAAPIAGRLTDKVDLRYLLVAGLVILGIGLMMNNHLTADSDFDDFFWPQVVRGIGVLLCLVAASRLALGSLPQAEVPNASGLFNLTRNLGGAVGLALLDTLLDIRVDHHWNALIPAIDTGREPTLYALQETGALVAGAANDPASAAIAHLATRVMTQAQVLSFNDLFLWIGLLYLCAIPLALLLHKPAPYRPAHHPYPQLPDADSGSAQHPPLWAPDPAQSTANHPACDRGHCSPREACAQRSGP